MSDAITSTLIHREGGKEILIATVRTYSSQVGTFIKKENKEAITQKKNEQFSGKGGMNEKINEHEGNKSVFSYIPDAVVHSWRDLTISKKRRLSEKYVHSLLALGHSPILTQYTHFSTPSTVRGKCVLSSTAK